MYVFVLRRFMPAFTTGTIYAHIQTLVVCIDSAFTVAMFVSISHVESLYTMDQDTELFCTRTSLSYVVTCEKIGFHFDLECYAG